MENETPRAFLGSDHSGMADLRDALRERLAIIGDEESRRDEANHIARLRAVSSKIDKLAAALPRPLDPQRILGTTVAALVSSV